MDKVKQILLEDFKDPSKSYDVRQRLVDPRTIVYCIVNNVKYSLK
jgi:hypothetical protein